MNSLAIVFEIPEILASIFNFLPRITDCLYVNKLITQTVILHSDYKYVWSLPASKRYDGIVQYNNIKIIHTCDDMPRLLNTSTRLGNINFVMYICDNIRIGIEYKMYAHKIACTYNQLHIARYLHEFHEAVVDLICWDEESVNQCNFISMYQYVTEHTYYKYFNVPDLILFKCMKGDLTFIKYISSIGTLRIIPHTNVLINSIKSGNIHLLLYLQDIGYNFSDEFTDHTECAARYGHLHILNFLASIKPLLYIKEQLLETAASSGQLNIIEAIYTDNTDLHTNPRIFTNATYAGHIEVAKYLLAREPRFNIYIIDTIYDVFTFGYIELFKYLYEQLPNKQSLLLNKLKIGTYVPSENYHQMLEIIAKY